MDLTDAVLNGEKLAISRLITAVENGTPNGLSALDKLFKHTGKAHLVGVTGSPGTGKSSLVNKLALELRRPGDGKPPRTVGIIAVDPTSPFSGGALLGDRVRMRELSGDQGVYIRSMAARGMLGGLSKRTSAAVQVLDAAGFDVILIETVGAGQSEVDIAGLAHTVVVVESPGMGDDIQAIKAGIMEIADIMVVNKSDRAGADATFKALRVMLELAHNIRSSHSLHHFMQQLPDQAEEEEINFETAWQVPLLRTNAIIGEGITELAAAIDAHAQKLKDNGEWHKREQDRLERELALLIEAELKERWLQKLDWDAFHELSDALGRRESTPQQVINQLFEQIHRAGGLFERNNS